METDTLEAIAMVIVALFAGLTILTPVLAFCARFALKPVMESWVKLREGQSSDQEKIMQDRRIALLEAELQSLQLQVQQRLDLRDFDRAIGQGDKQNS